MKMKACAICDKVRPPEYFYKKKGGLYGVDSACKVCRREYRNNRYHGRAIAPGDAWTKDLAQAHKRIKDKQK